MLLVVQLQPMHALTAVDMAVCQAASGAVPEKYRDREVQLCFYLMSLSTYMWAVRLGFLM